MLARVCHGHGGDWSCDRVDVWGKGERGREQGGGGEDSRLFILCFYYSFFFGWGGEKGDGREGREGIMYEYRWIEYANA